ncbi:MAG: FecR domain-containing protein [Spirochaetes bacterium]|nr:FecR domain-containing protein [Spirochaetota bacterium]
MKKFFICSLTLLAALSLTTCKKEDSKFSIKIYSIIGNVRIMAEGIVKKPEVGDLLTIGDTIKTDKLSMTDILFGTSGLIRIQPDSVITIASLIDATSNDMQMDMDRGKMYITLSKLEKGSFRVKTPTAVASVRGTSFRITALKTESKLDVINGSVKLNPVQDDKVVTDVEKIVETNQTATVNLQIAEMSVKEKMDIEVTALKSEEIKEIREEIQDVRIELIEKLDDDAKNEIKEKVLEAKKNEEAAREAEKKEKEEALKRQRELKRIEQARLARERVEQEKQKLEKETLEKEKLENEKIQKEKEKKEGKKERSSTVPANIQTL